MKEAKVPPVASYDPASVNRGPGCGCFVAAVGIVFLLIVVMCVGSFYVTMYTSFPLAMIERALEADGKVKVHGLRGSISSGFEIDKLEFESDGGHWSELRDVTFKFNGFFDLARNERLIIQEASVGGGTIYAEFENQGQLASDFNPKDLTEEIQEEFEDIRVEIEEEEDLQELAEIRIDVVSVENLQIINPKTEVTLEVKTVEFRDFQMLRGQVTRLGNLRVESDQLNLETLPSDVFADHKVAWKLKGTAKSRLHERLNADVPFEIDFAIEDDNRLVSQYDLFDGKVKMQNPYQSKSSFEFVDFSPAEYFEMSATLTPSHWNVVFAFAPIEANEQASEPASEPASELEANRKSGSKQKPPRSTELTVDSGGSFVLGTTEFQVLTDKVVLTTGQLAETPINAEGRVDKLLINAEIRLLKVAPYAAIRLSSDEIEDERELWTKLFFDRAFAELSIDDQTSVIKAIEFSRLEKPEKPVSEESKLPPQE